jgi:hypothetical protein
MADGMEDPTGLPVVRADLRAGTFLDPVPYDRAFMVTAGLPGAIRSVSVDVEEYSSLVPVRSGPDPLLTLESELRSLLDSSLVARMDVAQVDWLRKRMGGVLLRVCGPGAARSMRAVDLILPWRWGSGRSGGVERVVAPGTVFDVDGLPDSERTRFQLLVNDVVSAGSGLQREQRLDAVVREVIGSVRGVRVGKTAGDGIPTMRWNRLAGSPGSSEEDDLLEEAPMSIRWNRLDVGMEGRLGADGQTTEFRLAVPPLEASRHYTFTFAFERDPEAAEVAAFRSEARRYLRGATPIDVATDAREKGRRLQDLMRVAERLTGAVRIEYPGGMDTLMGTVERSARQLGRTEGSDGDPEALEVRIEKEAEALTAAFRRCGLLGRSTVMSRTEAANYVSADLGLMHAREITETGVYVGVNFYLRPVDKSIPLSLRGGFFRRFAFTLGIALQSIRDDDRTRDDLFASQSVMAGAGFRVTRSIRIGGGALLLRERDPDTFPLTENTRLAVTPYVSVSFDADVGSMLGG